MLNAVGLHVLVLGKIIERVGTTLRETVIAIQSNLRHLSTPFNCPVPSQFTARTFSALTLLVGRQKGHPACKKTKWWDAGVVICLGEVQICVWPS